MKPDIHYQVLEIEPGASQNEIKEAYKDLAKVWHPDRFANNPRLQQKAEEKLKQINTAYEFLKSYQPQVIQSKVKSEPKQSVVILLNCEKLEKLLELGKLKDADHETKRLLLELASREKEGWLRPEDVESFSPQALSAIDQLWIKYSNGRFGFSVQSKIWYKLGCNSSASTSTQTISENKFGQSVYWRKGSTWLAPWDSFNYDIQAPQGSLPREYIFALSGWWSYSKGWIGYLLWRFDEIFLKL
jgi:GUN4-like/DnaJ domain